MKKTPFQLKTLIVIDIVVNVGDALISMLYESNKMPWNWLILGLLIGFSLLCLIWWGLWRGSKLALFTEGLLVLYQMLNIPIGTIVALIKLSLLVQPSVRRHFDLERR